MLQPFIFSIQRRPNGKWREICSTSKRPPIWISVGNWQYPGILGTTTKISLFVFWSLTKSLSERSRNSHFFSFLGMKVSDSSSRTVAIRFFIPFQILNIGNRFFLFPFCSRFSGMIWLHLGSAPLLQKVFPIPDKWGRKRVSTVAGLEPAIPRSEVWCLIH